VSPANRVSLADYAGLLADVVHVIDVARRAAAGTNNVAMTATYWLIGCQIVREEQRGAARADYGERLMKRLAQDLSRRFGRGFSKRSLRQMRAFYLAWPRPGTVLAKSPSSPATALFPLPWSHYVRLLAVKSVHARAFYESETLRGGWTIHQLDRRIQSQFYEKNDALTRPAGRAVEVKARLRQGQRPITEGGQRPVMMRAKRAARSGMKVRAKR
jgi:DUF1016 N-terminal domain